MTSSKISQKEQDLKAAEKESIAKAREECKTALENACMIELDACRKALQNVEQLKHKLKQATNEEEKRALKQELKQAHSSTREVIGYAKKCRADQEKKILASETDTVSRIKQETREALAALKAENAAEKEDSLPVPHLPVTPEFETSAETGRLQQIKITAAEDAGRQGLDADAAKDKRAFAGDEFDHELNLDEILQPDFEEPLPFEVTEARPEQVFSDATLEEIRRELEETIKRLEQSRKGESKGKPESEVSEPGSNSQVDDTAEGIKEDFKNGLNETAATVPVEELAATGLPQDESSSEATALEPELPAEEVQLMEGRIKLIIEGSPSAKNIKTLGEKLKQAEGLKVILMGGSIEEGVLIFLLAQKPLALASFFGQIPGVVISSISGNEIRLQIA